MRIRARGEAVRRFILENVAGAPQSITRLTSDYFKISRQAVNIHLTRLTAEGALIATGSTRNRDYRLKSTDIWDSAYRRRGLDEHRVWIEDIQPRLKFLPENGLSIWEFAATEMINNAVDHSGASEITISMRYTAATTELWILDDGVGIFKKIQDALSLSEENHAVLELAKGKFTTDPKRHSGQGIFFTSRLMDEFTIMSGLIYFSHFSQTQQDRIQELQEPQKGTTIVMSLANHTARTTKEVFDAFSNPEDYAFDRTSIAVKLATYGSESLISRSQAKRLLARVERFKTAFFDFKNVDMIGQAFADEMFRVFVNAHPGTELVPVNTTKEVARMISRAQRTR